MEDRGGHKMARRTVLGLLASGAAALLAGCGFGGGSTYRFRMTVEVETPEGIKRGSSVYEVTAKYEPGMNPSGKIREQKLKGEAVAVDLPNGQTLFALLKTSNPMRQELALASMAALDPKFSNDWVESAERIMSGSDIRSPTEVVVSDYPLLVTFSDIADPKSVVLVNPTDLATAFGTGARLKGISLEVTNDAVTTGIKQRLPWLGTLQGALNKIPVSAYPPAGTPLPISANLNSSDFVM